jgi:hypothetical protein
MAFGLAVPTLSPHVIGVGLIEDTPRFQLHCWAVTRPAIINITITSHERKCVEFRLTALSSESVADCYLTGVAASLELPGPEKVPRICAVARRDSRCGSGRGCL